MRHERKSVATIFPPFETKNENVYVIPTYVVGRYSRYFIYTDYVGIRNWSRDIEERYTIDDRR